MVMYTIIYTLLLKYNTHEGTTAGVEMLAHFYVHIMQIMLLMFSCLRAGVCKVDCIVSHWHQNAQRWNRTEWHASGFVFA